jgi:hypothetical protein
MAMKKTTPPKPPRPGGNTPPDTRSMKFSSGVTVIGSMPWKTNLPHLKRDPLPEKTIKELKAMLAKIDAQKAKAAKDAKKNAKIIKKQNKKPLVTGRGPTKPITTTNTTGPKKPVIKVKPPRGGNIGGMLLGGSLTSRTK